MHLVVLVHIYYPIILLVQSHGASSHGALDQHVVPSIHRAAPYSGTLIDHLVESDSETTSHVCLLWRCDVHALIRIGAI